MVPSITLSHICFELPDGQHLLYDLSCAISHRLTALVGPNGIGKSVLARIAAGKLSPTSGQVLHQGRIGYVPQQWPGSAQDSVAQVLGLADALNAMQRISQGELEPVLFESAEPWWDWRSELEQVCQAISWSSGPQLLDVSRSIGSYSGGEQLRILWLAALLHKPDFLIMDEPSNHLDRQGRAQLYQWLQQSPLPVLVVSHDRELLEQVDFIIELSSHGLFQHSGNYDHYRAAHQQRLSLKREALDGARQKLRTERADAQAALEKQQQRAAKGKAKAKAQSWSALEIGGAKQAASASMQRNRRLQQNRVQQAQSRVSSAAEQLEWSEPIGFELPGSRVPAQRMICTVDQLVNGIDSPLHPPLSFELHGAQRLQIHGRNGSGKSLLLHALSGIQTARSGQARIHVPFAMLDQHASVLSPVLTAADNFRRLCPGFTEKEYRDRLAWVRLRAAKADIPLAGLSGGEQLKVAIACTLLGPVTPQLLLLDEPTNHLDLDSMEALEQALATYQGAMILVSHDSYFARKLDLTHHLNIDAELPEITC